jgi:hypothetical protein
VITSGLTTEADGYVTGIVLGAGDAYMRGAATTAHPALSASTAKVVVTECPEDGWRAYQSRLATAEAEDADAEETEASASMASGSLLDALLTGPEYTPGARELVHAASSRSATPPAEVERWQGLLIADVADWRSGAAKACREIAARERLTPIKRADFARERASLGEVAARTELAGGGTEGWHTQAAVYWVERALDGTPVQCRGLLDFLSPSGDRIRDLKRVRSLRGSRLAYSVEAYGWHIQAAAYQRAIHAVTGALPSYDWLFVRAVPRVAVTVRAPSVDMIECGQLEWLRAVDEWARGLQSGLWRGYESEGEPLAAPPSMVSRAEMLRAEMDGQ